MPWPSAPGPARYDYETYLRSNTTPNDYSAGDYKVTSSSDPNTGLTAQELGGVEGASLDRAWQVSTGRPDIHIAVLDSGIIWDDFGRMQDLRNKVALNWAELPPPAAANGVSDCQGVTLPARNQKLPSPGFPTCYDANQDGAFTVDDYAADPRVNPPNHAHFCCGSGNPAQNLLTPEDLIQVFSCYDATNAVEPVGHFINISATGPRTCDNGAQNTDNDGNGFAHDIAGWNFMEHTNDPFDEPRYGHGSGEARDSNAEANNGGAVGTCPSCMVMPLKVGDSFIADVNDFAQAVLYATDNGVQVIQEALGTLNNSAISQAAIDYAYRQGTVVIASAADESAGHHNQPGFANHTVVVNSVTQSPVPGPPHTYLLLNGCTNYGGHTIVAVESGACSSEATGISAGFAGLIYSTARNEVRLGHMAQYDTARNIDISPNEVKQILATSADDIDFEDAVPPRPRGDSGALASPTAPCTPITTDPPGTPANYNNPGSLGERFHSIAGWDQYFGYGRANANCAVRAVLAGSKIPPEVEINTPAWFSNVDTTVHTNIAVTGRVAATRSSGYQYKVQIAYGVQPHEDEWRTVYSSPHQTAPVNGTLATLTAAQIDSAMAAFTGQPHVVNPNGDQTDWKAPPYSKTPGKNQWDEFTFTVRVQATDDRSLTGEDRKSLQSHHDAGAGANSGQAVAGFPRTYDTDGASSPVLADLAGDNQNVLVFGTSNGEIHALRSDGSELPGWPTHVDRLCASQLPDDTGACTQKLREPAFGDPQLSSVANRSYAAILGAVAVGDLDRTGKLEVVAADYQGYIHVFEKDGSERAGFPVHVNFDYSRQGLPGMFNRDHDNRVQFGFASAPALADLNKDGKLEIIDGALDRHVYVFRPDGSLQPGFPVILQAPEKAASVDDVTHRLHLTANSGADYGTKIVSSPAVGDLLGDGNREIVLGRNEEYQVAQDGGYNTTAETQGGGLISLPCAVNSNACLLHAANGRGYAVFRDGYCHGLTSCPSSPPASVPANAYVPGWPVKLGIFDAELLPTVGSGVDTAPMLISTTCPLNSSPGLKVGIYSADGPVYVFGSDGKSCYGQGPGSDGLTHDRALGGALQPGPGSDSTDNWAANAFGTGAFGDLTGNGDLVLVTATTGVNKAADAIAPGHQLGAQTHVTAWSLATGQVHQGYPHYMNDLQFLAGPAIADILGDGNQEVMQGSGTSDFRAVGVGGLDVTGWSKNTGGWIVDSAAVSTFGPVQRQRVVTMTREGGLFAWETTAPACAGASWPKYKHDIWNTSEYETKAGRPATILDLTASMTGSTATLQFTAPHGYLFCGNSTGYEVRYSATGPIDDSNWAAATPVPQLVVPKAPGQPETLTIGNLPPGPLWFEVQAVNDGSRGGGNLGAISNPASSAPSPNIPEAPQTWSLLLGGLGAIIISLALRRRRAAG